MEYNTITMENAKGAKELYFRGLNEKENEYIKSLQVRFQEIRGTKAAGRAMFGYLDLEQKNKELTAAGNKLHQELKELQNEFNRFKRIVSNHFENEQRVINSKETLLTALNPAPIDNPIADPASNNKSTGSILERRTNGFTQLINP